MNEIFCGRGKDPVSIFRINKPPHVQLSSIQNLQKNSSKNVPKEKPCPRFQ
jgi:hypothetical protein